MRQRVWQGLWAARRSILAIGVLAGAVQLLMLVPGGPHHATKYLAALWVPALAMELVFEAAWRAGPNRDRLSDARGPIHVAILGVPIAAVIGLILDSSRPESFFFGLSPDQGEDLILASHVPLLAGFGFAAIGLARAFAGNRSARSVLGVMLGAAIVAAAFWWLRSDSFEPSPMFAVTVGVLLINVLVGRLLRASTPADPGPSPGAPTFERLG